MTEPKPRFSPLLLLSNGLLLLCAAVGLAASFLTLYASAPGPDGPSPLALYAADGLSALCGWGVLFALLALGAWSLPRYRAGAGGGLAAVWAAAVLWNWDSFLPGAQLTVSAISRLFSQRLALNSVYIFDCTLPPAEQLAAVELFLVLTLALLTLIVGWAIVCDSCWWMAVMFTLPILLPGLLADLFPAWIPFMALCACWCTLLLTHLCRKAAPDGRGWLNLIVLPAVALLLAGLTLALPRSGYTRPAWTYTAYNTIVNWTSRVSHLFEGWSGPFRGGVTYVGSAETVDLQNAGPLNYIGRTVLRVNSDYTGHLYLRGSSLAVYSDERWTALPDGTYQEYLDALEENDLDAPTPLILPALLRQPEHTYSITVDNVGASGSCVYAPYQLVNQSWEEAGMLPAEDAFLARRRGEWVQTAAFTPLHEVIAPYLTSAYRADHEAALREWLYRDYVREHYLDVPEGLRPFLGQFCEEHALPYYYSDLSSSYIPYISSYYGGSASLSYDLTSSSLYASDDRIYVPIAYASYVREVLNELCVYDPDTPLAPDGVDFVEYFLTESRQGYCMHFASAGVLLLRTMGIPARYVSGFTADTQAGQQVDVPDRAAHAWVEIYLDGFGWYPVEVTPDYDWTAFDPTVTGSPEESDPLPSAAPEESEPPLPSDELPLPSQGPLSGQDNPGQNGASLPPLTLLIIILAALIAALWLTQLLVKRLRRLRQTGQNPNRAALYSYRCLLRLKRWGGDVDEEALELAQRARFSQHTLSREERNVMARKVDRQRQRLCWGLHPVKRLFFRFWWGKPKRVESGEENS